MYNTSWYFIKRKKRKLNIEISEKFEVILIELTKIDKTSFFLKTTFKRGLLLSRTKTKEIKNEEMKNFFLIWS